MKKKQKERKLERLNTQLKALIKDESDWLANLANAAALLFNNLEDINWAGFYLLKEGELVLGPFQGLPACVRIQIGNGVCGSAVQDQKTYVVPDVHEFPNHIACDEASKSEIVVPMYVNDKIIGVLDVDSPIKRRFNDLEKEYFEEFVQILVRNSHLEHFLQG